MAHRVPSPVAVPCPTHEQVFGRTGMMNVGDLVCTGCQNRGEIYRDTNGPALSNVVPSTRHERRKIEILEADIFGPDGVGPGYRSTWPRPDRDSKVKPAGHRRCIPWKEYEALERHGQRVARGPQVVDLRDNYGLTWNEIGESLGISASAVRVYYRRAMAARAEDRSARRRRRKNRLSAPR